MAETLDLATLQQKRTNAEAAGDAAAVARYDARISALQPAATVPAEAPVTASGLGKAAATGGRLGVEGIAGMGGDLPELAGRGAGWLAGKVGAGEDMQSSISEGVEQAAAGPVAGTGRLLLKALLATGMLDPETVAQVQSIMTPTSTDVGAATDAMVEQLPESVAAPVQDVTRHQPENTAEEWAQTGGTFAGGALLPGSAAVRTARVAIPTTAVETTGQVVRKLAPEYEEAARMVAGILSGGGQALAEGGFRLRSNLRKLGTTPGGVSRVKQLLTEQGMTPQEATAAMKELGPEATLMDTGSVLRQEGQQIQAAGGEGRGVIDPILRKREAEATPRFEADVEAAVGPQLQRTDMLAALKDRAAALSPEYEAAHKAQVKPVETQGIVDALDSEMAVEKSNSIRSRLMDIRESLNLRGTDQLDPSSEGLHSARKAIDNIMYDAKGNKRDLGSGEAGVLTRYRKMIDEALGEAGPIKEVDVKRKQIGDEERAFGAGEEVYDVKRGMASPTEFQRTWDAMEPGARSRMLEGVNVETWRKLGVSANDRVELQRLLKGEGKWNQQKLATVIGDDKASALMDALGREKVFQETYQKVVQGSKTAESSRQKPQGFGEAVSQAVPEVAAATAVGGPAAGGGVAMSNLRRFLGDRLKSRGQPALDADVARLISSNRPDDLLQAVRVMQENQSFALPASMVSALLARQQEVQERKQR